MKIKIAVKKKYIGVVATFVSCVLGLLLLQEFWIQISQKPLSVLIIPLLFLISTIYTINYWLSLRFKEKLSDEVSKQVANDDWQKADKVKNHLWNKSYEEAYTLNILMGKIIFTSSWIEQNEIEKTLANPNFPDIIKQEFIKRAKNRKEDKSD